MAARRGILVILVGTAGLGLVLWRGAAPGQAESQAPTPMTTDSPHTPPPVQVIGVGPWVRYQDVRLGLTFEYPQNWVTGVEEGREQPYWQVIILGPRNADNSFSAGLTIRKLPRKVAGGLYADLQELIEARRKQTSANTSFQLLEESPWAVAETVNAWQVKYAMVIPLPSHSVQATPTRIQTHLVQFARHDSLYELSYSADAADFATYTHVFDHLLKSLAFTE